MYAARGGGGLIKSIQVCTRGWGYLRCQVRTQLDYLSHTFFFSSWFLQTLFWRNILILITKLVVYFFHSLFYSKKTKAFVKIFMFWIFTVKGEGGEGVQNWQFYCVRTLWMSPKMHSWWLSFYFCITDIFYPNYLNK